ncbi:PREDICTED: beta-1,3-N-acetylglucosaminyltransferase radical fringe [Calidris pugnax]|nr:PREDICTED: beta-1,3-N-acetylglucosaminyltransferase radical fringe [Calidris pugnax]
MAAAVTAAPGSRPRPPRPPAAFPLSRPSVPLPPPPAAPSSAAPTAPTTPKPSPGRAAAAGEAAGAGGGRARHRSSRNAGGSDTEGPGGGESRGPAQSGSPPGEAAAGLKGQAAPPPPPAAAAGPSGTPGTGESGLPGTRAGGGSGSPQPARKGRLSPSGESLELKDIFIAVKTTRKYHRSRLDLLLQTWISQARGQTFIFTDWEDRELRLKAGDHMINTNCSAVHTRQALCCKMSVEYDKFLESGQKWFCHVDDDNYVNPRTLLHLLSAFSHSQDVYVGRPSLDHPIEAADHVQSDGSKTTVKFWFATGGAGFCISRGLALKMSPWASLGNFISTAERVRLPDDCTIGYIIEGLLEVKLLHSPLFHSHLENLQRLQGESVLQQVTLSYGDPENKHNVVSVGGVFGLQQDPTRFKSVHCLLYPDTIWCPAKKMS